MDNPALMSSLERACHLGGDGARLLYWELRNPVDPLAEAFTLDVRHNVEQEPIGLA